MEVDEEWNELTDDEKAKANAEEQMLEEGRERDAERKKSKEEKNG